MGAHSSIGGSFNDASSLQHSFFSGPHSHEGAPNLTLALVLVFTLVLIVSGVGGGGTSGSTTFASTDFFIFPHLVLRVLLVLVLPFVQRGQESLHGHAVGIAVQSSLSGLLPLLLAGRLKLREFASLLCLRHWLVK